MYADMHIHSCFSDGTLYPEEIARAAKARGASLVCIADHDTLGAWDAFPAACQEHGLHFLTAVELHAQWGDVACHVLAYGFDLQDAAFRALVRENRAKLDSLSDVLIRRMAADCPAVSVEDYEQYAYEPTRGGWKALNYLLDRGLSDSQLASTKYYGTYGCNYADCGFLSVERLCEHIRAAGGVPVLAHPVDYFPTDDAFAAKLDELREMGIEGLECYYPLQDDAYTAACLAYCARRDWIVTCGCDFHGSFLPDTDICKIKVPVERLRLKGLSQHII